MSTIPTGLYPAISPGGYGFDSPDGALRTEVAGGANRYALDYDRGVQRFNVTLVLQDIQFQVWNHFYLYTTKKGALSFTMPLDSGWGVNNHTVNIVPGSYGVSNTNGSNWVVTFTVEAESQVYSYLTEGDLLLELFETYGTGTSAYFDALAQFATVDSNVLDFTIESDVYPMTLLLDFGNQFYGVQANG